MSILSCGAPGHWTQGLGRCPQIQAEWSRKGKRHLLGPTPAWDPVPCPPGSPSCTCGVWGLKRDRWVPPGPQECRVLCPGGGQGCVI